MFYYLLVRPFLKKKEGEKCPIAQRIKSVSECKKAAKQLGLEWGKTLSGPDDVPGCSVANDARSYVQFNTYEGALGSHTDFAEICTTAINTGEIL